MDGAPFDQAQMDDEPVDSGAGTPDPAAPPIVDRRKLLFGAGFGAVNLAMLRTISAPGRDAGNLAKILSEPGDAPQTSVLAGQDVEPTTSVPPRMANAAPPPGPDHVFDHVISGGRVIDPGSGFDAIANVGIDGATISSISFERLNSKQAAIDATGLVVAPGFIDLLSYQLNGYGEWFKLADGVTTNLCMHGIDAPAAEFFPKMAALRPPIHYGGAYDNAAIRPDIGSLGIYDEPSAEQVEQIIAAANTDVANGAIGLHLQPEYTPGITTQELMRHGELATRVGVPVFMHIRYSEDQEPGTQAEAIDEVVRLARETGAAVHVEHINSTGGTGRMAEAIGTLEAARAEGLEITACVYPYTFWATYLRSSRYVDWQEKYGISYGDLQVAGRSERLTEATYRTAYAENMLTAAFAMSDEDIDVALRARWVMIGSDAILETAHNNHPRATGCFSRVLGTYVRDRNVISLRAALGKMTIRPARLLQKASPDLARKGRMQMGADADVTIFNAETITDRSTIAEPWLPSTGVDWVLVNGTIAKRPTGSASDAEGRPLPDGVDTSVAPGSALRPI
ncbi:MAG: amidohydrolase family protein [Acidimicrobiales bacterium]|nr:amidohydrolase family protein [Acidimicrobiales bacterium]